MATPSERTAANACVFLGPSLTVQEAARLLPQAELRRPVRAGDIRQALHDGATHIGIIDGFFEQVPTVWHKEILFALSRGCWVYGGSSMGALRAAELHPYGVVGVGRIFEAYRSGLFEDDDEVAVVHGQAEHGFRELSTAMANLRFGLARAHALEIISQSAMQSLIDAAKRKFYAERSWQQLFLEAREIAAVSSVELAALESWFAQERPNQKRDDARALLARMADDLARDVAPFQPTFSFEPTRCWDHAERAFQKRVRATAKHESKSDG